MKRMVLLRCYERIANKEHGTCSECGLPIRAGDPYRAEVWVFDGKIMVRKSHNGCPIDPDFDEKYRRGEFDEGDYEFEFPLAA